MVYSKNIFKTTKIKTNAQSAFLRPGLHSNSRTYALWIYVFNLRPRAFLVCLAPKTFLKTLISAMQNFYLIYKY